MTMRRRKALSKLSNTRKSIARNIAAWKMHALPLVSSWRKSTTANACIRRSVIVRRWSSSATCGTPKRWGEDRHEFSEAWGSYRSDELVPLGASPLTHSQCSSASMSSNRLFLGRLLSSSACLRFAGRERFSKTKPSPYNDFSANGDNPLNSVSRPKGALQRHTTLRLQATPTKFSKKQSRDSGHGL